MLLSLYELENFIGNQYDFFISMFLLLFYFANGFFFNLFYLITEYGMLHTYIGW